MRTKVRRVLDQTAINALGVKMTPSVILGSWAIIYKTKETLDLKFCVSM